MPITDKKIGDFNPTAGAIANKSFRSFLPIRECTGEDCPIFKHCRYKKGGRCKFEWEYLLPTLRCYVDEKVGLGDLLTEMEILSIDELMTFHQHLFKLRIAEFVTPEVTFIDKTGVIRINPLFNEIRKTIDAIDAKRRRLNINAKWEEKFGSKARAVGRGKKTKPPSDLKDGYYESLFPKEEQEGE